MMRNVAVLIAVSAILAQASASAPESTFTEGISGEQGSISGAPVGQEESVDKTLNILNKGGISTMGGNDVATGSVSDKHSIVVCSEPGQVVCPSGVCAAVCPEEQLTDQGNGGAYNAEFTPNEHTFEKAPNVQGSAKQFTKLATNHANEKTRIQDLAIQNAEEAAGLSGASDHEANQMKTQKLAAWKQAVDEAMNRAAAAAAAYKAADAAHTAATVAVAQQKTRETAQEAVVAKAKETLEHEKEKLAKEKVELRKKREAKNNAMYHAETTAGEYETLKAAAISKDNALQEYIRQEKEKVKYREVAEKAVEKQAAEDLKKQEQQAASDLSHDQTGATGGSATTAVPDTPPAQEAAATGSAATEEPKKKAPQCMDCQDKKVNGKVESGLPEVYEKAGGFCSDCAEWKEAGQCDDAKYKTFMAHYCQKSCGCRDFETGSGHTEAPKEELHQMPSVKGLLDLP